MIVGQARVGLTRSICVLKVKQNWCACLIWSFSSMIGVENYNDSTDTYRDSFNWIIPTIHIISHEQVIRIWTLTIKEKDIIKFILKENRKEKQMETDGVEKKKRTWTCSIYFMEDAVRHKDKLIQKFTNTSILGGKNTK